MWLEVNIQVRQSSFAENQNPAYINDDIQPKWYAACSIQLIEAELKQIFRQTIK